MRGEAGFPQLRLGQRESKALVCGTSSRPAWKTWVPFGLATLDTPPAILGDALRARLDEPRHAQTGRLVMRAIFQDQLRHDLRRYSIRQQQESSALVIPRQREAKLRNPLSHIFSTTSRNQEESKSLATLGTTSFGGLGWECNSGRNGIGFSRCLCDGELGSVPTPRLVW